MTVQVQASDWPQPDQPKFDFLPNRTAHTAQHIELIYDSLKYIYDIDWYENLSMGDLVLLAAQSPGEYPELVSLFVLLTKSIRWFFDPVPRPQRSVPLRSLRHIRVATALWHSCAAMTPGLPRETRYGWPDSHGAPASPPMPWACQSGWSMSTLALAGRTWPVYTRAAGGAAMNVGPDGTEEIENLFSNQIRPFRPWPDTIYCKNLGQDAQWPGRVSPRYSLIRSLYRCLVLRICLCIETQMTGAGHRAVAAPGSLYQSPLNLMGLAISTHPVHTRPHDPGHYRDLHALLEVAVAFRFSSPTATLTIEPVQQELFRYCRFSGPHPNDVLGDPGPGRCWKIAKNFSIMIKPVDPAHPPIPYRTWLEVTPCPSGPFWNTYDITEAVNGVLIRRASRLQGNKRQVWHGTDGWVTLWDGGEWVGPTSGWVVQWSRPEWAQPYNVVLENPFFISGDMDDEFFSEASYQHARLWCLYPGYAECPGVQFALPQASVGGDAEFVSHRDWGMPVLSVNRTDATHIRNFFSNSPFNLTVANVFAVDYSLQSAPPPGSWLRDDPVIPGQPGVVKTCTLVPTWSIPPEITYRHYERDADYVSEWEQWVQYWMMKPLNFRGAGVIIGVDPNRRPIARQPEIAYRGRAPVCVYAHGH